MSNFDPLLVKPRLPPGGTPSGNDHDILTANAVQVIGFTIAGLALVGLSRFFPTLASFLAVAIVLGVGLTHSEEITALVKRYRDAIGVNDNG